MKNEKIKTILVDYLFITLGTFLLALGISVFLAPNKISAGGITSIGTVLLHLFGIKLSITNLVFNVVLFIFGYRYLGSYAVLKTIAGILFLSLFLEITSYLPIYTGDIVITTIAGGILMGAGVGFVVRQEASTGGSDFAALIINRFMPHISVASLILIIDCTIIVLAGIVFKSFTVTFYSAISLWLSSKVTDSIMTIGDNAKSIQVFSDKSEEIAQKIMVQFERGVTGVYAKGMYSNAEKLMLICVVSPKELPFLIHTVRKIDKDAFIVINDAKEVLGEGFKIKSSYDDITDKE